MNQPFYINWPQIRQKLALSEIKNYYQNLDTSDSNYTTIRNWINYYHNTHYPPVGIEHLLDAIIKFNVDNNTEDPKFHKIRYNALPEVKLEKERKRLENKEKMRLARIERKRLQEIENKACELFD